MKKGSEMNFKEANTRFTGKKYPSVFSALNVGQIKIHNRIVFPALRREKGGESNAKIT